MNKTLITLLLIFFLLSFGDNSVKLETKESKAYSLNCGPFNNYGYQTCIAGINSYILNVVASGNQNLSQWCWAASMQAIFAYYGYNIPQHVIVSQNFGGIVNMPATKAQMYKALNRQYQDQYGNYFTVTATSYNVNYVTASNLLANDRPLIIGTMGHAMVLTSLTYNRDINGNGQIIDAIVRDPWPNSGGRRSLRPQEFYNTDILFEINVY